MKYVRNTTVQAMMSEVGQITHDEGLKLHVYYDTEGYKTFGFGSLVTFNMPEWHYEEFTPVTQERCIEAFFNELQTLTINVPNKVWGDEFINFPFEAKKVFMNMSFNLGSVRLSGFKKMIAASKNYDWNEAADELLDSKYRRQVKGRAYRLADRLRSLDRRDNF